MNLTAVLWALVALHVAALVALLPSCVDRAAVAVLRGWYVRTVELVAAFAGAVPIVLAVGVSWAVEQLGEYSRQLGPLGTGVHPWHA